jgi:hypothetical protein
MVPSAAASSISHIKDSDTHLQQSNKHGFLFKVQFETHTNDALPHRILSHDAAVT